MRIVSLSIRNFKSIRNIEINDIENAFIVVGKNREDGYIRRYKSCCGAV